MSQEQVYKDAGFGASVPRGNSPALIVIDFTYGFTDTVYPSAMEAGAQIGVTNRLIGQARRNNAPVIFTVIAFEAAEIDVLPWLKKSVGMRALEAGSRLVEIDDRLDREPGDAVFVKKGASAFFGTNLASHLTGLGVDTLILTGATTSGCVRASAVDGVQSGFNVLLASDACADRAQPPHDSALYDVGQKYGDVITGKDALYYLASL